MFQINLLALGGVILLPLIGLAALVIFGGFMMARCCMKCTKAIGVLALLALLGAVVLSASSDVAHDLKVSDQPVFLEPDESLNGDAVQDVEEEVFLTSKTDAKSEDETPAPAASDNSQDADKAAPFQIVYPEDRPDWVVKGEDGPIIKKGKVVEMAINSGPQNSWGEARRALDAEVAKAVAAYIDEHLGVDGAGERLSLFVKPMERYREEPTFSVGPMKQAHALISLDERFRRQVERDWQDHLAASRLVQTALGFGMVIFLLATLFGFLKADTATRGHYTGRLKLMAVGVLLAALSAAFLVGRWSLTF